MIPVPTRSRRALLRLVVPAVLLAACGDESSKALVEADVGFGAPREDRDQGGYTLDPGALGGMPGAGGAGGGAVGGAPAESDAGTFWEADAAAGGGGAPPPGDGDCEDGDQRACESEGCVGGIQICSNGAWGACSPPPEQCNDRDDD